MCVSYYYRSRTDTAVAQVAREQREFFFAKPLGSAALCGWRKRVRIAVRVARVGVRPD